MAAAPFASEEGSKTMFNAVEKINILGGSKVARDPREIELDDMRGERVADSIKDDPRFSMVKADPDKGVEASNPGGSFEALMGGWLPSSHGPALNTAAFKTGEPD